MEDGEDSYRFQEVGSDTEMTGVNIEHGYQQASNGKQLLNKDDLYFNDMDIRAWERRTAALGAPPTRNDRGYQEDEGYYDDSGEPMSAAEYEEVLFQRVLDKIRLARAADLPDVQLTPEELDAYQSKLHGKRSPAARPSRNSRSSLLNDTMSVANASTASKKGSGSSRSRKEQQKPSLFASKQKKEKSSSRKSAPSNVASAPPPGFMVPGPDGQPIYTPITAFQGSLARDPLTPPPPPPPPAPWTAPINDQPPVPAYRSHRDMPGSFPGALPTSPHLYHSPLSEGRPPSTQPVTPSRDALGITTRSSKRSTAKSKASPVEPYQYHNFSSSSSTQSSPKPKYTRRVSSAESSYTAVPRRVPVPGQRPQTNYLDASLSPHAADLRVEREADRTPPAFGDDVAMPDVDVQTESERRERKSGVGGKEERRRKGKSKRK